MIGTPSPWTSQNSVLLRGDKSPVVASNAPYALPLFKRDNLNSQIFNILTPPLQEEVDSKNTFFEDGGVQDIYGILYFHYIELTLNMHT